MTHLSAHIIVFWIAAIALVTAFVFIGSAINRRLILHSRHAVARTHKVFKRK